MTPAPERRRHPLVARLGWFVLLWAAGVGAVGAIGYVIRLWLGP